MASDNSSNASRLNSTDQHGRQIDPSVLTAAEAVLPRALEFGINLLGDPAVVVNTLEEIAATVSAVEKGRSGGETPIRNLAGYVFRAFVRHVNRLKKREIAVLTALTSREALAPRSIDPSRQLEMEILLQEYLARFDFEEKDMCLRRLEGRSWDEVGKLHLISGHAAETRLRNAVKRVKAALAKGERKKSLLSTSQADKNEGLKAAMRTDVKKKATSA